MKYKIQKKHWWIKKLEDFANEEAYKWFLKQNEINQKIKAKEQEIIKKFDKERQELLDIKNIAEKNIKFYYKEIGKFKRQKENAEKILNKIDEEINLCLAKIITGDIGKPLSQEAKNTLNGTRIRKIKGADLLLTVKKLQMDGTNSQKKKLKGEQLTLVTN